MRTIAILSPSDRAALFRNTAGKMGVNEAIIEKDFWVCWMLDYLFHRNAYKNSLAFKGGTSLSKAYDLIKRFSEDIDLILDWRTLGYSENEPWKDRSNTQQDQFNQEANSKAEKFLKTKFIPALNKDLSEELKIAIECYVDANDPQTVKFIYPRSFSDAAILQEIRLEIGALAAWTPVKKQKITSYAAQYYGNSFEQSSTEILTLLPERTFWEKITILHREAFRSADKEFPSRYSRHYYDLYCMSLGDIKYSALADRELLSKVVEFKKKFYRSPWAKYDLADYGTIRLMPPTYNMRKLEDDYNHMKNMLFGDKPTFNQIMDTISKLEIEINHS